MTTKVLPHVMLDLETFGIGPFAAVISIGACRFNIETGDILARFHRKVDLGDIKGSIDASTVVWWLQQDEAARIALLEPAGRVSSAMAFADLYSFLFADGEEGDEEIAGLWSCGPTFDEVIARNQAKRILARDLPIPFRKSRCVRTFYMLAEQLGIRIERAEVAHDALSDAVAQAKTVSAVYQRIQRLKAGGAEL